MKISKSLPDLRSDKLLSALTVLAMLACLNATLGDEIHEAAKNGDVKKVKALLETTPKSLNEKDDFGKTPLYLATTGGYKDIVALLLEKGADADIKDNVGRRPLEITTNREIAMLLQKHTSPPFIEKGGDILTAAATGNAIMVKRLLDRNPELVRSRTTSLFSTPLHWAAAKGYIEVVALLLERGAPVNAQDLDGSTPLHEVAAYSSVEIADLLLTNGADVNLKDEMGRTPLHRAAGAKPEMVELLLNRGADPNAKDLAGFTPLHDAAWMAQNAKNAELLIAKGASVNAKADCNGWTPLDEAVYYGEVDVVKLLLAKKADVYAKTKKGESPTELLRIALADDDAKKKISEMLLQAQGINK